MNLETVINTSSHILAECAITERLRRNEAFSIHPTLFNAPLIYNNIGADELRKFYRQYRDIAINAELPILLHAPTWRVDKARLPEAGFDESLLFDTIKFMQELKTEKQDANSAVFIGALMGPQNDCYSPDQALSIEKAKEFHSWQSERLALANVNHIIAQTMPAVSEILGMSQAISETSIPYIMSFVIDRKANVLDGTPLVDAISYLDDNLSTPPLGYMVNCAYPTFICPDDQPSSLFKRLIGIQANSSSLDHSQLEGSDVLHQDDLNHWGESMLRLNREFGLKILGGCCGTDDQHLQYLADRLTKQS